MRKIQFLISAALVISPFVNAEVVNCDLIEKKAQENGASYYPRVEKRVIKQGRAYFHTAPHSKCKMPKTFIIKNDYVIAYSNYNGYDEVIFIDNNGVDTVGWIEEKLLKKVGKLGGEN